MTDLRQQIRRTLLVDARPDTAGVDGTADAIMALLKDREAPTMSDDLREKIAEAIKQHISMTVWIGEDTANIDATQAADAIMALIAPALREARVAALREVWKIARDEAANQDRRLDELSAERRRNPSDESTMQAKMVVAGMRTVAGGIADAIAALIEKETAP